MSKHYGMMVSYNDAIAWAERQPDSTAKDCALARMRYERDKTIPVPTKPYKGRYWTSYNCGNCGSGVDEAGWKYCPHCGFAIAGR